MTLDIAGPEHAGRLTVGLPDRLPSAPDAGAARTASRTGRWPRARALALLGFITRRWLLVVNTMLGLYVGLPIAAPLLLAAGLTGPAGAIYVTYRVFCHQLPYRSFFLFGQQAVYTERELAALPGISPLAFEPGNSFWGSVELGFKMAFCERDLALYGGMLLAGLAFVAVRRWLRPLDGRLFLLAAVPIALDGFTQLFGWRESTWELRLLTGGLFGVASVWFAYPYVDLAMQDLSRALARSKRCAV